jgi:hypothetical protein
MFRAGANKNWLVTYLRKDGSCSTYRVYAATSSEAIAATEAIKDCFRVVGCKVE